MRLSLYPRERWIKRRFAMPDGTIGLVASTQFDRMFAHHEASHAVVGWFLGMRVNYVTIDGKAHANLSGGSKFAQAVSTLVGYYETMQRAPHNWRGAKWDVVYTLRAHKEGGFDLHRAKKVTRRLLFVLSPMIAVVTEMLMIKGTVAWAMSREEAAFEMRRHARQRARRAKAGDLNAKVTSSGRPEVDDGRQSSLRRRRPGRHLLKVGRYYSKSVVRYHDGYAAACSSGPKP